MKNFLVLVFGVLSSFINAQLNMPGIPYQAVVRGVDGTAISNANVDVRFTLRDLDALNGLVVYQEQHALTTNNQGLMYSTIGEGVVLNGNFQTIDWSILPKFLQVEFRQNGLGEFIEMGNQQLMSVPYAMYCERANEVNNVSSIDSISIQNNHLLFYLANGSINDAGTIELILGCTDAQSCNYNAQATIDNGVCKSVGESCDDGNPSTFNDVYINDCVCQGVNNLLGCTNAFACNYNSLATTDNGSCVFIGAICDDEDGTTINDRYNGQCECIGVNPNAGTGNAAVLLPGNITCQDENISVSGCGGQTTLSYFDHVYDLVEIGGQCWFAENLATTKFNDGTELLEVTSPQQWSTNTLPGYANYQYVSQNEIFGMKYNGFVVRSDKNVCPLGWHVPSDCEWMYLEGQLGMNVFQQQQTNGRGVNLEGVKLKSNNYWESPSLSETNSSGFSALPAGILDIDNNQNYIYTFAFFWTRSSFGSEANWYRVLAAGESAITRRSVWPWGMINNGLSIRCLKD